MKKKHKTTFLLVLSCASLASSIGFATWIVQPQDDYVINNKIQAQPVAYIVGNKDVKYTSIERALDVAKSGDIVCLIPPVSKNYNDKTNPVLPDHVTYKISRDCEIKEGVTLLIPTDNDSINSITNSTTLNNYIEGLKKSEMDQGSTGYNSFATASKGKYLRVTLEIEENKTLKNNGTLVISGYLSGGNNSSGVIGQTSHSYSEIVLNKNSAIVQDSTNATTYCFGYISEKSLDNSSYFDVKKGNLYVPQIVTDYRGFYYSYAMTVEAIDKKRASPFNEFEYRNIDTLVNIYYGASVYSIINVYVKYDNVNVNEIIHDTKQIVGTTKSFFIQLSNIESSVGKKSYISFKYNPTTTISKIKFYGGFIMNNFSIDMTVSGQSLSLSTKNAFFPVSYHHDIELLNIGNQSEAVFAVTNQRLKLLTGSKLYIGDNSHLKGNELIAYTSFYDGTVGNGQGISNAGRKSYPLKEGAFVSVSTSGNITFNSFAGTIYCDNENNLSITTKTITSYEPWTMGTNSGISTKPWTIKNYLQLSEIMTVVPTTYKDKKRIWVGLNIFDVNSTFVPKIKIIVNESEEDITTYQKVLFFDDLKNYNIDLVSNVYSVYTGSSLYKKNTSVTYSISNSMIGVTNSNISISNNNNGINEFDVQSITINGSSHEMEKDTVMQLDVDINDINKSYVKTYTWKSLDTSIATVDKNGLVTAIDIGETKIQVVCGDAVGEYAITVKESETVVIPVDSIEITESSGKKPHDTFKDGEFTFNLTINPTDADVSSIVWTIKYEGGGSTSDRQYLIDNNTKVTSISDTRKVKISLNGGVNANTSLGASADELSLICTVTDKKGNVTTASFYIVNDTSCLAKNTPILMADGTYKNIENIVYGDEIITWNFFTGQYESQKVAIIVDHGEDIYQILELKFSNMKTLSIIGDHGLFDYDLNKFVYIDVGNYKEYLNHRFAIYEKGNTNLVTLVGASICEKKTHAYSITSAFNYNAIAGDLLTAPPPGEFYNWINMSDKMRYDVDEFNADIEKYGLYDYSVFEPYGISYETFVAFNGQYLKIPVEKSIFSFDYIIKLFNQYKDWING